MRGGNAVVEHSQKGQQTPLISPPVTFGHDAAKKLKASVFLASMWGLQDGGDSTKL